MEINSHQVIQRLPSETLDNVLVILHHVGGDAAVEAVGHLDGVVDRVLHQGPGREGGARHQDGAVEQACRAEGEGSQYSRPEMHLPFT